MYCIPVKEVYTLLLTEHIALPFTVSLPSAGNSLLPKIDGLSNLYRRTKGRNNNYTQAAPGYWVHPRQTWSHGHSPRSPKDSPLYDFQNSAQMSVPSLPVSNQPTSEIPVPPYPNLISHLSYYAFTCLLFLPTSKSRAFFFGYCCIPRA